MSNINSITLSSILARKRREKGITQEELAEYMGVSKAAVSKWEKDQSYPDITLLPQLAAYFGISVDGLLGYSPQLTRENIIKLCKELSTDFINMPFDEAVSKCKGITKKYYSCYPLLYHMVALLINHCTSAGDEEKQALLIEEAISLCRRIISGSGDALLSKDALYLQCYCAVLHETPDEVFSILGESIGTLGITEDSLISTAFHLAGNTAKAKEVAQCGMYTHLISLIMSTILYVAWSEDMFDTAETALLKAMELIRSYNIEKIDANTASKVYLTGINLYCKHSRLVKALDMVDGYVDLCINTFFPYKIKGDSFFTDIEAWLDSDELGSTLYYDTKMIKRNMLQSLTLQPNIAVLHSEPRYKSAVQTLAGYERAD